MPITFSTSLIGGFSLSFIELKRLMREITEQLMNSKIENVYQMEDRSLVFKLWKEYEKCELRIAPGKCLYIVRGEYKKPQKPSEHALRFRRILNNSIIRKVELLSGERIVIFEIEKGYGEIFKLIIELLPKGTLILTDASGKILECLETLVMKDRKIMVGEEYRFPPRKTSITSISDNIDEVLNSIDKNRRVVSGLAVDAGLGGRYAEEVVLIAGVDKSKKFSELTIEEYSMIREAIIKVLEFVDSGNPVVIESSEDVYPLPYPLKSFKIQNGKIIQTSDFNEAVRIAYERSILHQVTKDAINKIEEEIKQLEEEIENKNKTLQKLTELSRQKKDLAKTLLTFSSEIEQLKYSEISKETSINEVRVKVDISLKKIIVSSPHGEAELHFNESIARQASKIFDEAKNIDSAIERLKGELGQIRERINKLLRRKESILHQELENISPKLREGKKNWFEKYRWFYTSEGFLAVAGKDASSNQALIKKHLEKDDLVFHSEVRGAPILILKKGVYSTEKSIIEAAQFAACYSRAWREGLQYVSVYYVRSDQVSFSPPPGHYLPKGGVIIKGEKKYVTVKLELAIGAEDGKLVWGPSQTLEGRIRKIVKIVPGNKKAKTLAEEIVNCIFKELESREKTEYIEKIMQIIPYGSGLIS